jgi:threonine/homoserine/homoserine lactone efflux protein
VLQLLGMAGVAFFVGLSGALSPGPLTVLAIREGARRGWRAGPMATAGHAVVEATTIVVLALGMSVVVRDHPAVTATISLLGGAVLLWMAWGLMRSLPSAMLPRRVEEAGVRLRGLDVAGLRSVGAMAVVVTVSNPYWLLWWATVGTKLTVDSLALGWAGPPAVFLGHITSDLIWLTLVAGLVGSGARWMGDRAYRGLLAICAAFLAVLGVVFVSGGVRFFT